MGYLLADYSTTGSATGDIVIGCIGAFAVLAAGFAGIRSFWRSWVNLSNTVQSLGDLAEIAPALKQIAAELSHNGGASLKDALVRQGEALELLMRQVQETQTSLTEIHTSHETHLKLAHSRGRTQRSDTA